MIDKDLIRKIRALEIKTKRKVRSTFSGEYHSVFKGQGIEFEEVRPYNPGDDIRDIDWNVSARTGDLYIKRFREEREIVLYILVDLSASGDFGSAKTRRETAAEISALLGFSALSNQDRVGFIGFTTEVEIFIPPAKGRMHLMNILRTLLPYKPRHKGTDINAALDFLGRVQKKESIVFLVSDFYDTGYSRKISSLSRKHDFITFNLYDRREEKLENWGLIDMKDPETGKTITIDSSSKKVQEVWKRKNSVRRNKMASEHRRRGADHADLDISGDWPGQISRLFIARQARREH